MSLSSISTAAAIGTGGADATEVAIGTGGGAAAAAIGTGDVGVAIGTWGGATDCGAGVCTGAGAGLWGQQMVVGQATRHLNLAQLSKLRSATAATTPPTTPAV